MKEQFANFIESPNRQSYLALRETIVNSDDYQPYSADAFESAERLYEQQELDQAREVLIAAMPNLLLSPRAHLMLSFLYSKQGDERSSQMELMLASACIDGILATGDGSAQSPYLVTRISDEYDVLDHFDKQLASQALRQSDDQHLDVIRCTDGSEIWFDISDAYNQLNKMRGA